MPNNCIDGLSAEQLCASRTQVKAGVERCNGSVLQISDGGTNTWLLQNDKHVCDFA